MNECTLELPWPPSLNHYKIIGRIVKTKSGKLFQQRINSNDTKKFYHDVWIKVYQLKRLKGLPELHRDEISLEVYVTLHPPNKRRHDVDNSLKVLLDSFVRAGLIKDDSQITRLIVEKKDIITHGKVIVTIRELENEPR